ncbi:MAG: TonB-dependent receptor, partial [Candidatus Omnitrophica bacterium]|nr:TonB-dependent receptor [Candidatus Omnitrophota bacterium]
TSTFSAKHRYNVKAAYINNEFDITEKLKVDFGGRLDDYSNFGTEFNPSLSALFKFDDNNKIHGLISRSFRAPTFNDLYWPDEGWAKGNSTLKPETGITKEIGFQKQINKYILSDITYYRSDYDDLINWSEVSGVWQPINIGSAVIDGIELTNSFFLCRDLVLDIGYTYLRAIDSETHTYLVYQPKNKADFTLKYKNLSGWSADITGQYTGTRYHSADNSTSVKQFFVLGLDVKKQINSNLTVFGSIDNILNRKYQVIKYYPMPGFAVTGGVKLEF